jgi:hypothetical protein
MVQNQGSGVLIAAIDVHVPRGPNRWPVAVLYASPVPRDIAQVGKELVV